MIVAYLKLISQDTPGETVHKATRKYNLDRH